MIDDIDRELYARAEKIKERAYAPYSNFLVGAVLRARDGTLFDGVNVERGLGVWRIRHVAAVNQATSRHST